MLRRRRPGVGARSLNSSWRLALGTVVGVALWLCRHVEYDTHRPRDRRLADGSADDRCEASRSRTGRADERDPLALGFLNTTAVALSGSQISLTDVNS